MASTVWLTIIDATAPNIDQPSDIRYEEDTTGHAITWQLTDAHPYWYNITRDGLLVAEGEWTGTAISVDVDGLPVGTYTYILTVYDSSGNFTRHTVIVAVTAELSDPKSEGESKEPSAATPGFTLCVLLFVGFAGFLSHKKLRPR